MPITGDGAVGSWRARTSTRGLPVPATAHTTGSPSVAATTRSSSRGLGRPGTRVMVMRGDKLPSRADGAGGLDFVAPAEAPDGERLLLGAVDGARGLPRARRRGRRAIGRRARWPSCAGWSTTSTMSSCRWPCTPSRSAGWHRRHPHCAVCGARDRDRRGRCVTQVSAVRRVALPAHRSGGDHAGRRRRGPLPDGPQLGSRRGLVLDPGRLRRARGGAGAGGRPRGLRGDRASRSTDVSTPAASRGRSRPA